MRFCLFCFTSLLSSDLQTMKCHYYNFFEIYNFSIDIFLFTFDTMCFAFSHESNMPIFPLCFLSWLGVPSTFHLTSFLKHEVIVPTSCQFPQHLPIGRN